MLVFRYLKDFEEAELASFKLINKGGGLMKANF